MPYFRHRDAPDPLITQTMQANVIAALNFAITETGCSKQEAIVTLLKVAIDAGMSVEQAHDTIFGAGFYKKMAGKIWEALQPA